MVLAIDPGVRAGLASKSGGKYTAQTLPLARLFRELDKLPTGLVSEVRIEWGQAHKTVYARYGAAGASTSLSRSVGANHGIGAAVAAYCEAKGWPVVKVPPTGKGRKEIAKARARALGFPTATEHAADALLMLD